MRLYGPLDVKGYLALIQSEKKRYPVLKSFRLLVFLNGEDISKTCCFANDLTGECKRFRREENRYVINPATREVQIDTWTGLVRLKWVRIK